MGKKTNLIVGAVSTVAATAILTGCDLYGKESFKITFDTNGGNNIAQIEAQWEEKVTLPTPEREGYTFAGWCYDKSLTNPVPENIVIEADITLYAKWTINQYTISFDSKGGSEVTSIKANYKADITLPSPTREGYTFEGWYTEAEYENVFDAKVPAKNITVYAKWKVCSVNITFDSNANDVVGSLEKKTYRFSDENLNLPKAPYSRQGYTFKGWSLTAEGAVAFEDEANIRTLSTENQDVTLYAVWEINEYSVRLIDGNITFDTITADYKSTFTIPSSQPTKVGYSFVGWGSYTLTSDTKFQEGKTYYTLDTDHYVKATVVVGNDVSGSYYELVEYTNREMPLNGIDLYAMWSINSYKVSFDSKGGTSYEDINKNFGEEITLSSPTKEGHTFLYWKHGDNTYQANSKFVVPASNVTLEAIYDVNEYNLVFNTKVLGVSVPTEKAEYGEVVTLPYPSDRTGFTFKGWSYKGEVYTLTYTVPADENIVFEAVWEEIEYTLKFVNGSEVHHSEKLNYDDDVPTPENPSKVGYDFLGWYIDEECTSKYTFGSMPASDLTLYAGWKLQTYSITFNANSGVAGGTTQEFEYGVKEKLDKAVVSKIGHTFLGWSTTPSGEVEYADEAEYTIGLENVTLYAVWQANKYYITFDANGGKEENKTQEFVYGVKEALDASIFTRTGYSFKGWSTTKDGQVQYVDGVDYTIEDEDVTLYAVWEKNSYVVSFNSDGGNKINSITDKYEAKITLPAVSKEGYSFLGWSYEGKTYQVGDEFVIPANPVEFKATWSINSYDIKYNSDGGTLVESVTQNYGTAVELPEITKEGHTFLGWYLDGQKVTSLTVPAEDITLVAQWSVNSYSVSYDSDGGTAVTGGSQKYGSKVNLPVIEKVGYTFAGWYLDGKLVETLTVPAEDITLVAHWTANTNTAYVVNHHYETVDGKGYAVESVNKTGTTASLTEAEVVNKTGFVAGEVVQQTIAADGSTIINIYYTRNIYVVEFVEVVDEENVVIKKINVKHGALINSSDIPNVDRENYVYEWQFDFASEITGKTTIYVEYTLIENQLVLYSEGQIFKNLGNQGAGTDIASILDANEPTRTGYTFEGWCTDSGLSVDLSSTIMPETALSLYAKWSTNSYDIKYNSDGGTPVESVSQNYGTAVKLPEITKEGHTFLGWYLDGQKVTSLTVPAEDITLVAQWSVNSYTVLFDANGGNDVSSIKDSYGKEIVIPNASREGYTFAGWIYDGKTYKSGDKYVITADENVEFVAQWTINQYSITFNEMGGVEIDDIRKDYGTVIDLPSASKEGNSFLGWAVSEGGIVVYEEGDEYTFGAEDVELFAVYQINKYTVTFDSAKGTAVNPVTQNYGTSVVLPTVTREGYTFAGWYLDGKLVETLTVPAKAITLVAHWDVNSYKVSFNTNGGLNMDTVTEEFGSEITLSTPVKEGYTFAGWIYDGKTYQSGEKFTIIASDVVFSASWNINSYTVTFNSAGGTEGGSATQNYGTSVVLPTVTKEGHTFIGWYLDGQKVTSLTVPAENIELVAHWEVNSYNLIYVTNGGSEIASEEVLYGADIPEFGITTRVGYTFLGWYLDDTFQQEFDSVLLEKMPARDITVYAKWKINKYTVKFVSNGVTVNSGEVAYNVTGNFIDNPTRVGYTFGGWSLTEGGTAVTGNTYTVGTEDITFYAIWTVNSYQISFDTGTEEVIEAKSGEFGTIVTLPVPTRDGYTFLGWEYDGLLYNGSIEIFEDKNIVLTAVWTQETLDVVFQDRLGGNVLYTTTSTSSNVSFMEYMEKLYLNHQSFTYLRSTMDNAASGDLTQIFGMLAWLDQLSKSNLITDIETLKTYTIGTASSVGVTLTMSDEQATESLGNIMRCFIKNNQLALDNDIYTTIAYYAQTFLSNNEGGLQMTTNAIRQYEMYYVYKANGFVPTRDGYYFNGWGQYMEGTTLYQYAKWVKKMDTPSNLKVQSVNDNSVTYVWNEVKTDNPSDIVVYEVTYTVKDETGQAIRHITERVSGTVSYKVSNLSNGYTVSLQVRAINPDVEQTGTYTEVAPDDGTTVTVDPVNVNSELSSAVEYEHVVSQSAEVTSSGDYYYLKADGTFVFYESRYYTFSTVEHIEILSGTDAAEYLELTGEDNVLNILGKGKANTIQFTFRTYTKASGSFIEGVKYYAYDSNSGTYELQSVTYGEEIGAGYYVGKDYQAEIRSSVDGVAAGDRINSYRNTANNIDSSNYLKKEVTPYTVGVATVGEQKDYTDYGYYKDINDVVWHNGFKFDFNGTASGGKELSVEEFNLEYKFFTVSGEEVDLTGLYAFDPSNEVFYFDSSLVGNSYKVVASPKADGYYVTADKEPEAGKKYYTLGVNGEYSDAGVLETFVGGTTYYEYYTNIALPVKVKKQIETDKANGSADNDPYINKYSESFTFTLTEGINVFDQDDLYKAYADPSVSNIILHSDIELKLRSAQVVYYDYLHTVPSDVADKLLPSTYGSVEIKEGTTPLMTKDDGYGAKIWSTTNPGGDVYSFTAYDMTEENPSIKTFYYVGASGEYAIEEAEWVYDFNKYETSRDGEFYLINTYMNENYGKDDGYETGTIFKRGKKANGDAAEELTLTGNYFTIDGSKLPYITSRYSCAVTVIPTASYHIQNGSTSIFETTSGANTTYQNLTLISNTSNANVSINGEAAQLMPMEDYLEITSGGYMGLRSSGKDTTITTDNVVILNSLLGFTVADKSNGNVNYTYVANTWGNAYYSNSGYKTTIQNSKFENSGSGAIDVEDNAEGDGINNPDVYVDMNTVTIDNKVSGEEAWFKAFAMEVIVMGMKSQIDSEISAYGYTCIHEVIDPITNLPSEKINLAFLGRKGVTKNTGYTETVLFDPGFERVIKDGNPTPFYSNGKKTYLITEKEATKDQTFIICIEVRPIA